MKIYAAIYNNGEQWEDNYECVDAVFSTYEKAVEYIEGQGYAKNPNDKYKQTWDNAEPMDDIYGAYSYMFIEEYELDKPKYSDTVEESC